MFISKVEIQKLLAEPEDHLSAILSIHPGAGGTESQDWASMLYRLYIRWCEKHNYKTNLLRSNTKVKVFYNKEGTLIRKRFYVPSREGTLWRVFTFDSSRSGSGFTVVDNMTYENTAGNIY
mgnify:CR=1 FL=1